MSAASSAARLLCALLAAAAAGCVQLNTAHCGNNDGDLSCAGATPYCSVCIADNNGCVAEEAAPHCQASSATSGPSSMSTTTDGTDSTSTADGSTTTAGSTSSTTTTTTGEPPPTCSDGDLDPGEQCDGDALGGKDCAAVMGDVEFGGGDLACADNCVFDVSGCCLGADAECQLGGSPSCCEGLNCSLTGGGLETLTTCR